MDHCDPNIQSKLKDDTSILIIKPMVIILEFQQGFFCKSDIKSGFESRRKHL